VYLPHSSDDSPGILKIVFEVRRIKLEKLRYFIEKVDIMSSFALDFIAVYL